MAYNAILYFLLTFCLNCLRPRHQMIQFFWMISPVGVGHIQQQIMQICINVDAVCFCCFDNAVYGCGCRSSFGGICKKPVLSTNCKRANCVFGSVVRNTAPTVKQIVFHIFFLVQGICNGFSQSRALQYLQIFKPTPKSLKNGFSSSRRLILRSSEERSFRSLSIIKSWSQ